MLTACQDDTAGAGSTAGSTPESAASAVPESKGVSGTFAGGTVEYLATGKYIVNANGKEQQFLTAEDTKVYGAGTICGEYNQKADNPCTVDDLEKVFKGGSIAADVVMKDGVATKVTERPAPDEGDPVDEGKGGSDAPAGEKSPETTIDGINKGKGVNGTWFGNVRYLATGKYTVLDMKDTEQQFFVAEDTAI
jgi:hypothetical protein